MSEVEIKNFDECAEVIKGIETRAQVGASTYPLSLNSGEHRFHLLLESHRRLQPAKIRKKVSIKCCFAIIKIPFCSAFSLFLCSR
jgi:hypothetical protein